MATAEYDGNVRIRDAATGKVLTDWAAHPGGVQCLKFTRDGKTLVTCGKDGTAKVWDLASHDLKVTMSGKTTALYTLDLSHDDKNLLTGSKDAAATLWDVDTGDQKGEIREYLGSVEVVRYSPNGTLFAVAGWDGSVQLRGSTTGSLVRTLQGQGGGLLSMAFTPDSNALGRRKRDRRDPSLGRRVRRRASYNPSARRRRPRNRLLPRWQVDGDRRPRLDRQDLGLRRS